MTTFAAPPDSTGPACAVEGQQNGPNPWPGVRQSGRFFENDEIAGLIARGLFYARAGVPIHFQGTAGRGKTAIALEIARRLGRPVTMMTGHDWLTAEDLIGREVGETRTSVVDKYIQRVRRSEESLRFDWEDSLLAAAMQNGHTLVYDEFTRATAQANGILLSVLEEGVLISTNRLAPVSRIDAHPEFRIVLTSNPHDYAGVNTTPDALLDRMLTFPLGDFAMQTEAGIVAARTGLQPEMSVRIVALLHKLNKAADMSGPNSLRPTIMIAQIAAARLRSAQQLSDALLAQIVADVLIGRGMDVTVGGIAKDLTTLDPEGIA